jgi:trehalose/maltose hydrolase-like predicted phosphorylase
VIPPDEYASNVTDSIYTNVVAVLALQAASVAAQTLSKDPSVYAAWQDAATRIVLLGPDAVTGVHPEYAGYKGEQIKQADVILLGFPLGAGTLTNVTPAVRAADLAYYATVTDAGGPAMTWGAFAIGNVETGNWAEAASNLNRSFANAQPPFRVWTEEADGSGAPNFLTGAGGFLQTAYFGYSQMRLNDPTAVACGGLPCLSLIPALPPGATTVRLRGLSYLGNRLDITYNSSSLCVTVRLDEEDRTGETRLAARRAYEPVPSGSAVPVPGVGLLPTEPLSARSQWSRVVLAGGKRLKLAAVLTLVDATHNPVGLPVGLEVCVPLGPIGLVGVPNP